LAGVRWIVVEGGYSWNVEGGMWNKKCNAMYDDYDEE
jgi:hypothetical protein